ncbi:MAG: hypothetical protein WBA87_04595 [Microbacterium sp.]
MSLMERVRELGAEDAYIEAGTVAGARGVLMREIARIARPDAVQRPRRRSLTGVGVWGLVAGAAVTAIVVGSVLAPTAPDAAAADVLELAADVTITAVDTGLAPGQYLRIQEQGEHLQFWRSAWSDDHDEATVPFNVGRDGADAAVLVRGTHELFIPADRSGDWFYRGGSAEVVKSFGDRGVDAARDWASYDAEGTRGNDVFERLPAGEFLAEGADTPPMPYLADNYRPYYAEMPREPAALLDWLLARSGMSGPEADRWLVASLSDPSAINLMPADLRATFFRAIALLPGFEVDSRDGDLVGLRYGASADRTTTIVIDTSKGFVESIAEGFGAGGLTDGVPEMVTRVTITVVDSAP